jgi:hypothetical protein
VPLTQYRFETLSAVARTAKQQRKWDDLDRNGQEEHFFFAVALRPNAGHGHLILEVF